MTVFALTATTVLGLRRALIKTVIAHLPAQGEMTKQEQADGLGLTRARLYALEAGRVDQFSLDALVGLSLRLGLTVRMSVTRPYTRDE